MSSLNYGVEEITQGVPTFTGVRHHSKQRQTTPARMTRGQLYQTLKHSVIGKKLTHSEINLIEYRKLLYITKAPPPSHL